MNFGSVYVFCALRVARGEEGPRDLEFLHNVSYLTDLIVMSDRLILAVILECRTVWVK
jgi:hypothetical protein